MDTDVVQPPAPPGAGGIDLTTGSVVGHLIRFSLPLLLGNAFHTAYSIVNAVWIGRGLGANAMTAVVQIFPIFFVLMAIALGLSLASTVLVSQAYGAQEWDRLRKIVQNSVVLMGAMSLLCVAVGYMSAGHLLRLIGTPAVALPMATDYLRLQVFTIPFMFGMFLLASMMRGAGDSKTPMYFQAGALLLTVVLDPLLIFGWLGFPRMGLNGTVAANLISQVCGVGLLAFYLHKKKHVVAPDWRRLAMDMPTTVLTLKIGVPSMVQQTLVSMGFFFIVRMVNGFGADSAAAYGLATRLDQLAFMPAMAIGTAVSSLVGQNVGAQEYDRVRRFFRSGVMMSLGMTLFASLLAIALPTQLMHLFVKDANVVATGAHYLRVVAVAYLMFSVLFACNGVINGAGHTLPTTMFTLIGFWVVRVPLAKYLSTAWNDVEGIWYAIVISSAVGMCMSLAYYFSGFWKHPVKQPAQQSTPRFSQTSDE